MVMCNYKVMITKAYTTPRLHPLQTFFRMLGSTILTPHKDMNRKIPLYSYLHYMRVTLKTLKQKAST